MKTATTKKSFLLTAVMTVALVYYLLPLVWLVINSTKSQGDLFSTPGLAFGNSFDLFANIDRLFAYEGGIYGSWLANTLLYAAAGALGSAILCSLGGYALAHFAFPGKKAAFAIIVGAVMVPGSVLALPIFLLCSQVGITNTALAVILPSLANPFALYLMAIFAAQSVPPELLEAARMDGAGELRIFFSIALRLIAPGLVTVTLFQITAAWNNYFLPLIVLNDSGLFPLGVGLAQLNARATQNDSALNAAGLYPTVLVGSLIAIIPLVLAFLLLQRFWRSGLAAGAVKL
ncbi:carbohydrate ABC transporter permease [Herbiconiux flava]|jgi:multiple sugar transport system permease protein|uniref:Multiple sugar transport system permease protein n=1 Tax=Herbiconiux flava TaxID=881268 RepID=A0A852SLJ4_9MICO|nr:carbohydrate ABC transporter permease [Herbiconiux flava]NYD69861.1 multiple sugar transport system permease protein [Herbiconiux flava]GLK16610.1 sugar ABC transporter permease [Herbiconiux flava]